MNKCLRLKCKGMLSELFYTKIQKGATKYGIEGVVQMAALGIYDIIMCGHRSFVDDFLDLIHEELNNESIESIEVEPFIKDKDYRGVFRIIKK